MVKIQRRDFEESIKNPICVVVCTIPYCGQCGKLKNHIVSTLEINNPYVKFYDYDISSDIDIVEKYQIVNTPTILFFKEGQLIKKTGYLSEEDWTHVFKKSK